MTSDLAGRRTAFATRASNVQFTRSEFITKTMAEEVQQTNFVALPQHTTFDEQEWTPVDSSYGAAFPCCSHLSHETRRMLKLSLIAFLGVVLMLVVILVPFPDTVDGMVYRIGLITVYVGIGWRYMLLDDDDDHYDQGNPLL